MFINTKNRMLSKFLLILVTITSLLSISALPDKLGILDQSKLAENSVNDRLIMKPHLMSQYSNHSPILIESNTDFSLQASQEGWPGNGSYANPYQINGLSIANSSANLIAIKNTNVFFQLSNSLLDCVNWYQFGLVLSNVSNGMIRNNIVNKAEYGIVIISSVNMTCISNTVSNNQRKGYYLVDTNSITISNNIITNNEKDFEYNMYASDWWNGIRLIRSNNNSISNNTINNNGYVGIRLDSSLNNHIAKNTIKNHDSGIGLLTGSKNNRIEKNFLINNDAGYFSEQNQGIVANNIIRNNTFHNSDVGLWVNSEHDLISFNIIYNNDIGVQLGVKDPVYDLYYESTNTFLENNVVFNNSIGVLMEDSQYSTIVNNTIYTNDLFGILINSSSKNNLIEVNDFVANNLGSYSQAHDNGSANNFSHNYWYEWTTPDKNDDGIIDKPYSIAGGAKNEDTSPRVSFNNPNSPTDIQAPPAKSSSGWTIIIL
ncbi:MAG: right-handed parallel beta-helix repeat-containing protein, partial [Candidatus Hodarchaeales archaeon]